MGIATNKDSTSAQAWAISTPVMPRNVGRIRIIGIKQIPFLAEAVIEALTPLPIDCSIMLLMTIAPDKGSVQAWNLRAATPTVIAAGSFEKPEIMYGAKMKATAPIPTRTIVEYLTRT